MDGPSVNIKFYNECIQKHREECHHQLIDMGSCSLHIIHGALRTGEIKSEWDLKHILKGTYQILRDSPARSEDYECVTVSDIYPFSFCSTRWVYGSCKLDYCYIVIYDLWIVSYNECCCTIYLTLYQRLAKQLFSFIWVVTVLIFLDLELFQLLWTQLNNCECVLVYVFAWMHNDPFKLWTKKDCWIQRKLPWLFRIIVTMASDYDEDNGSDIGISFSIQYLDWQLLWQWDLLTELIDV